MPLLLEKMNLRCLFLDNEFEVYFPRQCLNGYLEGYFRVSHSLTISPIQHVDDVRSSKDGGHLDDVPPYPPGMIVQY